MSLSSPVTTSPILPPSPLPDQHSCYFHNANDQRLTSGLVFSSHFLTMVRRSARIAAKNHVHVPLTLLDLPPEVRILMYEALLDDMLHMKRELSVPPRQIPQTPIRLARVASQCSRWRDRSQSPLGVQAASGRAKNSPSPLQAWREEC